MLKYIIPLFLIIYIISIYNSLIIQRNKVKEAFSGIDVQLKKRYDLIPNLVRTVKQYMEHEKEVLTEVTRLRNKAVNENLSSQEEFNINELLSQKLVSINMVVENYPELKADESFEHLQRSLNEIESQLSAARRAYNANVRKYNNLIETFPSRIIANKKGFTKFDYFETDKSENDFKNVKEYFNT